MLAPLSRLLDVREDRGGRYAPGAAWIPFSQLQSTLSELPPPHEPFSILDSGPEAKQAQDFLARGGRAVTLQEIHNWDNQETLFRMWSPNPFLEANVTGRKPGRALDLGCGAGRESVFLASQGWQVTAIDRLEDAVTRGKQLADQHGVNDRIQWISSEPATGDLFEYVDLVCMLFFLEDSVLETLNYTLPQGAELLLETFTETHFQKFKKPAFTKLISPAVIAKYLPNLEILAYEEDWRESGKHTGRLHARRC